MCFLSPTTSSGWGYFFIKINFKLFMDMSELTELVDFPNYWAHPNGTIYTTKISPRYNPKGELRLLQPKYNKSGYIYYGMWNDVGNNRSKRFWPRAHRIIYQTLVGDIPNGYEIDHIDNDRQNNSIDNLRIVTHSQNMLKAFARKRALKQQNICA
jgi:hypothetical protein